MKEVNIEQGIRKDDLKIWKCGDLVMADVRM
jgi:hypothetical protein